MKLSKHNTGGIAATRERWGFSQRQLAEQLGVSKSSIGMAEIGRRKLPAAVWIKMAQLELAMASFQAPASDANPDQTTFDRRKQVERTSLREMKFKLRLYKMIAELEKKTEQYKQIQNQLRLIERMLVIEDGEPGNIRHFNLRVQRDQLLRQLEKCSEAEQARLQNEIDLLSAKSPLDNR